MSTPTSKLESKQPRPAALYIGALLSAAVENLLHPLDTIAKRLQDYKGKIPFSRAGFKIAQQVVTESSLFDGFSAALTYRLVQRGIMYGTQPLVNQWIQKNYGDEIESMVDVKYKTVVTQAVSGGVMGVFEVSFLPLDTAKVKKQLKDTRGLLTILAQDNLKLYSAAPITALRNLNATISLFGGSEFMKIVFWKIKEGEEATFSQKLSSSFVGSLLAVAMSSPTDVIKTRIQKSPNKTTGLEECRRLITESGVKGFAKGIYPRFFVIAPRLTVIKTAAEYFAPAVEELMRKAKSGPNRTL